MKIMMYFNKDVNRRRKLIGEREHVCSRFIDEGLKGVVEIV
jgi:hypothetical protein